MRQLAVNRAPSARGASKARSASFIVPPVLSEEFARGVMSANWMTRDGRLVRPRSHVSLLHRRYVLWARCEGLSYADIETACGLSPNVALRIVLRAQGNPVSFAECLFVARVRGGDSGEDVRYVCRYCCGTLFQYEGDASQCAHGHLTGIV